MYVRMYVLIKILFVDVQMVHALLTLSFLIFAHLLRCFQKNCKKAEGKLKQTETLFFNN